MCISSKRLTSLLSADRSPADLVNRTLGINLIPQGFQVFSGRYFTREIASDQCRSNSLATRLIVTPSNFEPRLIDCFVSSRLERDWTKNPAWFLYLRTALHRLSQERRQMLTAQGTTCDKYLTAAEPYFDVQLFRLTLPKVHDASEWFLKSKNNLDAKQIHLSPPIKCDGQIEQPPLDLDLALMRLSQRSHLLRVTDSSNTLARSLSHLHHVKRLPCSHKGKAPVTLVAAEPSLVSPKTRILLEQQGAIPWLIQIPSIDRTGNVKQRKPISARQTYRRCCSEQFAEQDEFLFHCTRANFGPWPNQSKSRHLLEILHGNIGQRTPLSTLAKIARDGQLIASSKWNRTAIPVVSFTEINLVEIAGKRTFRSHLGHWDFEPFGIGIRKSSLEQQFVTRPVIYGDESTYETLSANSRPFFQKAVTRSPSGNRIDWTTEQEWRVIGNIDINRFSIEDLVWFVRDANDAVQLCSEWRDSLFAEVGEYRIVTLT